MQSFTIFCAQYLFVVPIALVVITFVFLEPQLRRTLFLRLFGVALVGAAFVIIGGNEWHETRPFILHHITPLIPHVNDNGFPSDHTLVAASCALVLMPYRWILSVVGIIASTLVAWARVATMLHSPADVIASFAVAAFACILVQTLIRKRQKEIPEMEPSFERHQKAA